MKRLILHRFVLPLLLVSVLSSCNKLRNWKYNPPNVLLISVEGLSRALPCYGDTVFQTANIDRLAMRSIVFEDALAQHPSAQHALTSIYTGWYPEHALTYTDDGLYLNSLFPGLESGDYRIAFPGLTELKEGITAPIRVIKPVRQAELEKVDDSEGNEAVTRQVFRLWSKYEGEPFFINAHYQMEATLQDSNQVAYQSALTEVDEEVGRLLDQLMEIQEASNTIVILLGVNPMGVRVKNMDCGYFKPQYVKAPFLYYDFRQDSSLRVPQLMELRSLFPTLVECCFIDGQEVHACNAPNIQQIADRDFGDIRYHDISLCGDGNCFAAYTPDFLFIYKTGGQKELFRLDSFRSERPLKDSVLTDSLMRISSAKQTQSKID